MPEFAFTKYARSSLMQVANLVLASLILNENLEAQTIAKFKAVSFSNQTATQSAGEFEDEFAPMVIVTKQLPALKNLAAQSASDADLILREDELVLGIEINGRARAYPINMLTGSTRQIINDELDGVSISATWCHLSHTGIVYASDVNGQRLTFAVSGKQWKKNLVMRDEETESLWSQIRGECMEGQLKGTMLKTLPSLVTDWKSWKTMHPKSTAAILNQTPENFTRDYDNDLKSVLVGIRDASGQKAWRFNDLIVVQTINDFYQGVPVVVSIDRTSHSATIFKRELGSQILEFDAHPDGRIVDRETESVWDLQQGKAIDGKLKGKRLVQVPSMVSLTEAWETHFPKSEYYVRPVQARNGTYSFTMVASVVGLFFFIGLIAILRVTSTK